MIGQEQLPRELHSYLKKLPGEPVLGAQWEASWALLEAIPFVIHAEKGLFSQAFLIYI